jgi:hypothetical protein
LLSDSTIATYYHGFLGTVDHETDKWCYTVEATSAVSEWPECWTIAFVDTEEEAKAECEKALLEAGKNAPERNPNSGDINYWVPDHDATCDHKTGRCNR